MCWYCENGMPEPVGAVYDKYIDLVGERALMFGPAHLVWGDYNFGESSIRWCIEHADEYRGTLTDAEVLAVLASLEELLSIPEPIRNPAPLGDD